MSQRIEIRASSLPGWHDCPRRGAASQFANMLRAAGFETRRRSGNNIGAGIGTACHLGINNYLQSKIDGSNHSAVHDALDCIRQQFQKEMQTDSTTPNVETAALQVERMVSAYLPVAQQITPKKVEFSLDAHIDGDFYLTGHPDIYDSNNVIRDLKFGKSCSPYQAQVGGYSLLAKSNDLEVSAVQIDYVARAAKSKPQPEPQFINAETDPSYALPVAETAAMKTVEAIAGQIEKFQNTRDPWSFPANPNSNLCSKKWCQAWGTPFCDLGKPEKEGEN